MELTVILMCASLFSIVIGLRYEECEATQGRLVEVKISTCPGSESVCSMKKDTKATMDITFIETAANNHVLVDEHVIIFNIPLPLPHYSSDACVNSGLTCPLHKGREYHYNTTILISKYFPPLQPP
ncbi:NPC intracellular cholesterol transporter 2 homolog a-like [Periplaneta americana]|uniref:NPC intracellular cholesterol transporter 2 homolog a-like n=1 Tax=Periplaneta americana TaxID=6978 RepID=UPI0037E83C01